MKNNLFSKTTTTTKIHGNSGIVKVLEISLMISLMLGLTEDSWILTALFFFQSVAVCCSG